MSGGLPDGRAAWLAMHILPHEPALRGWLRRRAVAGIEIDDVVQESYAILATLTDIDHVDNPRAYLFRTAWSIVAKQLRRAQVIPMQTVADLADLHMPDDTPDQERQLSARSELLRLAAAIEALPAGCREVFRLRKVDGLSQRDVAQRLGLAESTVEKHMARAVRLLGQTLGAPKTDDRPSRVLPFRKRRQML